MTWVLMESYLHTFCIHFILKNVRNERNKLGNKRNRLQNRLGTEEIKIIYLKWEYALFSEIRKAKLYPPVKIDPSAPTFQVPELGLYPTPQL